MRSHVRLQDYQVRCPFCKSGNNGVVDTRKFDTTIIRVRRCLSCEKVFRTHEEYYPIEFLTITQKIYIKSK